MEVTKDNNVKIHDDVSEIRALAVKKFNDRHNTKWPDVITNGSFFEHFENILKHNWAKFDPDGIPPALKNELANVITAKIIPPPSLTSFLYSSLYIPDPRELSLILENIINEYNLELKQKACYSKL